MSGGAPGRAATIAGSAVRFSGPHETSLKELIFATVSEALERSGRGREEIDGVVIAASDVLDGRSITTMLNAGVAGAFERDEVRLSDEGLIGAIYGDLRLRSGEASRIVVASWGKVSESGGTLLSHLDSEPFFSRPVGINGVVGQAFELSAAIAAEELAGAPAAASVVAAAERDKAGVGALEDESWVAFPIRREHLPPIVDGCAAVVLEAGGEGPELIATGWVSGDRETAATELVEASRAQLGGADEGAERIELDACHSFQAAFLLDALRPGPESWLRRWDEAAELCPSGGNFGGYLPVGSGLMHLARAAEAVRSGEVGRALVHGGALWQRHQALAVVGA